jgi:hypothetical protein
MRDIISEFEKSFALATDAISFVESLDEYALDGDWCF